MKLRFIDLPPRAPGPSRTLILLHGFGADERDLLPIGHELDERLRVVSLQAPISLGGPARAWYNLMQDARGIAFDPDEAREGLRLAVEAVEELAAKDPQPLLCGFSQGAGMALGVLLLKPELVSGVLALSAVPPILDPKEYAAPEKLRGKRVFAAHGTEDPLLPIELGRGTRAELTKLGFDVEWHEYPMGHMVVPQELDDARAWLQRSSASSSS